MNWIGLLKTLAPIILMTIPKVPKELVPLIVNGIETAETLHAAGVDKKAAVMQLADDALQGVNAAKPGAVPVSDVLAAVSDGIDATISTVNAVHAIHEAHAE